MLNSQCSLLQPFIVCVISAVSKHTYKLPVVVSYLFRGNSTAFIVVKRVVMTTGLNLSQEYYLYMIADIHHHMRGGKEGFATECLYGASYSFVFPRVLSIVHA